MSIKRKHKDKYGEWSGNPKGNKPDFSRCVEDVWGDSFISHQCTRKLGHGPDGMYCKQHAKRFNP